MSTKKIFLFVPCYIDQFFPEQASKACAILRHLGYQVEVLPDQPCCGQIAYNSGYFDEARIFARKWVTFFPAGSHVVIPGASCAYMVKEVYPSLFDPGTFSLPVFVEDFTSFLLKHQLKDLFTPEFVGKIAIHQSCTGLRKLYGGKNLTYAILSNFPDLEIVKTPVDSHCCGFGGTFSIKYPEISVDMGTYKLEKISEVGATFLLISDVSCYMHLHAIKEKKGFPLEILTLIDFLYQSIKK